MRDDILRDHLRRIDECINAAREHEYFACVERDATLSQEHVVLATQCRRRAAHYEQAIALIVAAPMPPTEVPR
jgi:hypothetical protein